MTVLFVVNVVFVSLFLFSVVYGYKLYLFISNIFMLLRMSLGIVLFLNIFNMNIDCCGVVNVSYLYICLDVC